MRAPILALVVCGSVASMAVMQTSARTQSQPAPDAAALRATLDRYCVTCHNEKLHTAGVALDSVDPAAPDVNAELWERVVAKLRAGSMPPAGRPRPDRATYDAAATALERALDRAWASHPAPPTSSAVHRLNRTEYNNAIRDLFAFDAASVDVKPLLPGDETADGSFDNFAEALSISPAHLERYLSVARQVTRLAVGLAPPTVKRFTSWPSSRTSSCCGQPIPLM